MRKGLRTLLKMLEFDSIEEFEHFGIGQIYNKPADRDIFIEKLRKSKRLTDYDLVLKTKKKQFNQYHSQCISGR